MIRASRTAFQEQPNGDLVCTITIPAADRAAVFADVDMPISLSATPITLERVGADVAALSDRLKAMVVQSAQVIAEAADFTVEIDAEAETADKPPTQTIGVDGMDTASVIEAVTSGAQAWNHPAAPHLDRLFKHPPFQAFAMERLPKDPFTGPMEAATRLITKKVKGKPMDVAMAAMERTMDEYIEWTAKQGFITWPEKQA